MLDGFIIRSFRFDFFSFLSIFCSIYFILLYFVSFSFSFLLVLLFLFFFFYTGFILDYLKHWTRTNVRACARAHSPFLADVARNASNICAGSYRDYVCASITDRIANFTAIRCQLHADRRLNQTKMMMSVCFWPTTLTNFSFSSPSIKYSLFKYSYIRKLDQNH